MKRYSMNAHLISKYGQQKLARNEHLKQSVDKILKRIVWDISLEAHVREVRLWRDMNRNVKTLKCQNKQ